MRSGSYGSTNSRCCEVCRNDAGALAGRQRIQVNTDLTAYYAARALEYERVYDTAERQADLVNLRSRVSEYFRACHVLEVACGTGYWTTEIATAAASVTATDISKEVLEVATAKPSLQSGNVIFALGDAFDLAAVPGRFDAGFAGFWWSHVPRERMRTFLYGFHRRIGAGSRVMLVDNRYVEGNSTPISRRDAAGNTFQQRALSTGDTYEVLKNFPAESEVRNQLVTHGAADLKIVLLDYYWYATYRTTAADWPP
jgi:SAM-dependent methyltransferase